MNRPTPSAATTRAPQRGRRRVLAATSASAAALLLAGCQWTAPLQTENDYEPADGTSTTLGDVEVKNILVVAEQENGAGTLMGMGVNETAQPVQVSFQLQGGAGGGSPVSITIPAGGAARISEPGGTQSTLPSVPAPPGGLIDLQVTTAGAGSNTVRVPVLAPDGPYEGLQPGGSPSPTATTQSPGGSPTTSPTSPPAPQSPTTSAPGETNPAVPEPAQSPDG